jgi:hypothetical protein
MDDIEKNRVEYVARLEEQVAHLQRQLNELRPQAEKWTPVVAGEITPEKEVRITLGFGGKRTTATIGASAFASHTVQDLTYSITNTLAESMLVEKISEVIKPEVERLMRGAQSLQGTSKW